MPEQPLVTILTNTKDRCSLIPRCIESIRAQTYQNYEHIIADGGSDDTEKIVASYNDPRIKYIKVPTGGIIAQTKKAFEISRGQYITFLDDDDEYCPEKISKQVELITSLPEEYGMIYGSMTYYDHNTNEIIGEHTAELEGGDLLDIAVANPIICGTPTLMFRREVFESLGGTWIPNIGNEFSDWAFVCKALKMGWKIGALRESYLKIYVNHGSTRMSDPSQTIAHAEKYILFHNYFLNEYRDIFRRNPKSAKLHLEYLFCFNMLARHRLQAFKCWLRLIRANFSFRSIALLPYYLYKSFV